MRRATLAALLATMPAILHAQFVLAGENPGAAQPATSGPAALPPAALDPLVSGRPAGLASGAVAPVPLDTTVVTATRIPTPAADVAAGVTVIDRQTIEERGYTTLVEALTTVPGTRVVQSGGPGGNASVFIRGAGSNHTLVLRDGVPVNDPADPGGAYNFGVDTLEDVERIEVVRGPMSGLYGSGAIGGVINLITRRVEGPPQASVTVAGGLPAAALLNARVAGSAGRFDYNLGLQSQSYLGFDATPRRERAYTGERDGFRSQTGSAELGYTPIPGTRLSALLRGRRSVFGFDDVGYPAFDDPNDSGHDTNWFGRLGGTSSLFGGAWQTSLFVARNQTDRRYTNLLDAADPNAAVEDSRYHGRRTDLQWNNTVRLGEGAFATFGYEHIADAADTRLNSLSGGYLYTASTRASQSTDAGHAGLQATVLRRLTLNGDLRAETVSGVGGAVTWRTGAALALPELLSHLKASYGTAFRAPSLFDRYGVDAAGYLGNPALKPERSRGGDVGWRIDAPGFGRADLLSAGITYFRNDIRDQIETQFAPVYTSVNVARARTQGVEASLVLRPAAWLQLDATYTYTDARRLPGRDLLLRRPRNQATLDARIRPAPKLLIVPELLYTGAFADQIVDDSGFPVGIGRARSGLLANLNVTYQWRPQVALFAWAKNIGGSRFEPASGFQVWGPSFLAGTRVGF